MLRWDYSAQVTSFPSIFCTCTGAVGGNSLRAQEQPVVLSRGWHGVARLGRPTGKSNSNTIIMGDFNTPLTPMDRLFRQKISRETQVLNDTLS